MNEFDIERMSNNLNSDFIKEREYNYKYQEEKERIIDETYTNGFPDNPFFDDPCEM